MISVRALTKLYGDFTAVRDVSFDVGAGEILGLVGPNGAGKTTTLRCLAGIIAPSSGAVTIAGHDIQKDPIPAKRALAFIPDEPHLFDYLSVEEHLRFIARLYGVTDVETRIGPLHDPSVLILDEPLTGLDPAGMRRMRATVTARAARGTSVILSSHLLNLVEELCTKLLVLRQGATVAYGTIGEIIEAHPSLASKSLEEVFLTLTASDSA